MTNWLKTLAGGTRARLLTLLRRSQLSIGELASALKVTDNAVRTHVAALGRDGIVESVGTRRAEVGKPATLYALTPEGEELFPKAYALVLGELVAEIATQEGRDKAIELLEAVGRRAAGAPSSAADAEARVQEAAAVLRALGGDLEVQRTDTGWKLQGFGCPLSAVTGGHAEVCALAHALVSAKTGLAVTECCERGARPRCAFTIAA